MKKETLIDYTEGEGVEQIDLKGNVSIKRLNFSEKNQLDEQATDITVTGTHPQVRVKTSKIRELGLLASIVASDLIKTNYVLDPVTKLINPVHSAYPLDHQGILNLPNEVGSTLFLAYMEVNEVTDKKKGV